MQSREVKPALTYVSLAEELRSIVAAKKHAEQIREYTVSWGSKKTNPRDWYLFLMASEMESKTGNRGIPALMKFIDAARQAHGDMDEFLDEESLKKRIQRYRRRLKKIQVITSQILNSSGNTKATRRQFGDIPF
jgi:hypothetical protein